MKYSRPLSPVPAAPLWAAILVCSICVAFGALSGTAGSGRAASGPAASAGTSSGSASAGADFRLAIIGDRTGSTVPGVYDAVVREVNLLSPDIVFTVGDHIQGYTEDPQLLASEWKEFNSIIQTLKAPYYLCPGNHDITTPGMLGAWKANTGHDPCYSFDHEGVHFTIFETGRWETSQDWWEHSGYRDWLTKDLQAHAHDRMTVVIFHIPYWYDTLAEGKPDSLHQLFRRTGVDYVFNGHYHLYGSAVYDGIHYTIVGSSGGAMDSDSFDGGAFFQYVWCTVHGDSLEWAVLKKGSAWPAEQITVADLKFNERVGRDYIKMPVARIDEGPKTASFPYTVQIMNDAGAPLESTLRWDLSANWTVQPAEQAISILPQAKSQNRFDVRLVQGVYPLPILRFDYPYRAGKVFHYEGPLPVLRTQTVERMLSAPVIDGKLDEAGWREARRMTEFGSPAGTACTIEGTEILLGYDQKNLYIGARAHQADLTQLVAKVDTRDGTVPQDDCIGLFLCPDPAETTFVQLYLNSKGVVYDARYTALPSGDTRGQGPKWDGVYQVAAGTEAGAWTVEAAIPFETLGTAAPAYGTEWRANFRRKEISKASSADWQYPIGFVPKKFGYLRFE